MRYMQLQRHEILLSLKEGSLEKTFSKSNLARANINHSLVKQQLSNQNASFYNNTILLNMFVMGQNEAG